MLYVKMRCLGKTQGINFIDSTHIKVCHNRRIHQHKVFEGLAERGQCSIGWFYGFKLHLIINDKGEILSFYLTKGNVDDRNLRHMMEMTKDNFDTGGQRYLYQVTGINQPLIELHKYSGFGKIKSISYRER